MTHMPRNTPSTFFYESIFSELLHTARYTLRIYDFIPRAYDLFSRTTAQVGNRVTLIKQLKKASLPNCFSNIW